MTQHIKQRFANQPLKPERDRDLGSLVSLGKFSSVCNMMRAPDHQAENPTVKLQ